MRISTIEVYDQNYVKQRRPAVCRALLFCVATFCITVTSGYSSPGLTVFYHADAGVITEMVFSWPGLGRWLINAIASRITQPFPPE